MVQLSTRPTPSTKTEVKELLRLTIPLASAQVAQAATGFVDTVMMGWLGQQTLAAGGLATTTFTTLLVAASGVVFGVSPLVAAFGAGNRRKIQLLTQQGFWLSLFLTIPAMVILGNVDSLMVQFGQAKSVVSLADTYLNVMLWGFFPALAFAMLKSVVSSLSQPRPITIIVVIGTLFNAVGNYVLGFGKLGFPTMGLTGIALASVLSQWVMLIFLVIYILKHEQLIPI